jgi:hypothetical protein
VASRKPSESRAEPGLTQAAEKASMVIRGLQARLQQRPLEPSQETAEDLERQLAHYFSRSTPPAGYSALNDLRSRVVDGVADRILRNWEQNSAIEAAVIERLIERLLARFGEPIL